MTDRRFVDRPGWFDQWEWGSTLDYGDDHWPLNPVDEIVIHWGGSTQSQPRDETFQVSPPDTDFEMSILRGWQRFHRGKGWRDIAYSYAVGNTGNRYRLRGWNQNGATSGDIDGDGIATSSESIAVVWIGGTAGPIPTPDAVAAFEQIVQLVRADSATEPTVRLSPHSSHKPTACPGNFLRDWVADVNNRPDLEEDGMPYAQFVNLVDSLFAGRPDEFQGDPSYFYRAANEGGIYDVPDAPDWVNFWSAFTRAISLT